ncbi:MAG: divergent polysaccharide deacetylase family protein [Alphaproteobacteria bacterium]|nr:divergent polysaccharide deacetylase family protein [Alphaproteobacteria bacterium]
MKRFSWMPALSEVRAILTKFNLAKFNLGRIKQYRLPLTLGAATLLGGIGLGMILGLLDRAPGDDRSGERARPSPPAPVTAPLSEEEPRRRLTITPLPTEEETLEKMASQGFTLEEPDGDPPVESTEFGEAIYVEPPPFTPPSDESSEGSKAEQTRQLAVVARPPALDDVDGKAVTPAWLRHAVAVPGLGPDRGEDHRPLIAIVVDDLGMNRHRTAQTTALTPPLTLAFLPYANDLKRQTDSARKAGHELLVHVPMEPLNGAYDPGPKALMTGMKDKEINRLLDWDLARFEGFVGLNNHMGSKFTAHREGMETVMKALRKRGLLYLDSRTTGATKGLELARELNVPHAVRNVFLDNEVSVEAIRSRLADLEDVARRQGFAVGICHPHRATLEALAEWIATVDQRGFALVPLSAIVRRRMELAG